MAVYTEISTSEAAELLRQLGLGQLTKLEGCSGGIENTNYFASSDISEYVLTVFERLSFEQLPYYLHLMKHLARFSKRENTPHRSEYGIQPQRNGSTRSCWRKIFANKC